MIITILAWIGGISLWVMGYLLTKKIILKHKIEIEDDCMLFLFWVPLLIMILIVKLIVWTEAIIKLPQQVDDLEKQIKKLNKRKKKK